MTKDKEDGTDRLVMDRGYAWMILLGVSLSTFIEMGNFKTFGIYFITFLDEFKASATMTALINATYCVFFSVFVLPVETVIVERFTCRTVLLVGALASSLALIFSSFAQNIETLLFTNGILLALGSACTHGPSMIILGMYFNRKRGLTNSIAISFGSLGGFVQPILFTAMMTEYGLRGALLVQGGILFNLVLGAFICRPYALSEKFANPKPTSHQKFEDKMSEKKEIEEELLKEVNTDTKFDTVLTTKNIRLRVNGHVEECQISGYKSSTTSIAQFSSAYDLYSPSIADIHQGTESTNNKQKKSCLGKFVDFSILKNKLVLLFTVVFCFGSIASCMAYLFIPPHARDRGLSEQKIGILASAICLAETIGRIFIALIADRNFIQRYKIIMFGLFLTSLVLQFTWFLHDFSHFLSFTILLGLFSGALISVYAPVCVDFIGVEKFHKAMGVLHMGQGVTLGVTGFLIGFLRDVTGSWVVGFHVMGACGIIAGCLLLLVPRISQREQGKAKIEGKPT